MTTIQANCCAPAGLASLERTRFFPRQLVTPEDLTQDQIYFRDKARRHNRLLHGWGVVCGVRVKPAADEQRRPVPWKLAIEPGYVLGPYGDEILIDRCVCLDIRTSGIDGTDLDCVDEGADPWCSDVRVERDPKTPLYVAVRYAECKSRPVRSQGAGCGCDDSLCEYSRIRDSYVIAVLDKLPSGHDPMPPSDWWSAIWAAIFGCTKDRHTKDWVPRPCPLCPEEPWVVLADVTHDADGNLTIRNFPHRRFVLSFSGVYTHCPWQDTSSAHYAAGLSSNAGAMLAALAGAVATGAAGDARAPDGRPIREMSMGELLAMNPEELAGVLNAIREAQGASGSVPMDALSAAMERLWRDRGEKPGG